MKITKHNIIFIIVAALALILAIFGIISATSCVYIFSRILLILCSFLLVVVALLYVAISHLSDDKEPNFFLCDDKFENNFSPADLTFEKVATRADDFIEYIGGADALLRRKKFVDGDFGVGAVLRPIVAYRLLQHAAKDKAVLNMIGNLDDTTLSVLCGALQNAGEKDLPNAIVRYIERAGDPDNFARFLNGNYKYMQNKMMSYVLRNLELFY